MATASQVTEYIEGSLDEDDEQNGDRHLPPAEQFAEILHTRMLQHVLAAQGPLSSP